MRYLVGVIVASVWLATTLAHEHDGHHCIHDQLLHENPELLNTSSLTQEYGLRHGRQLSALNWEPIRITVDYNDLLGDPDMTAEKAEYLTSLISDPSIAKIQQLLSVKRVQVRASVLRKRW